MISSKEQLVEKAINRRHTRCFEDVFIGYEERFACQRGFQPF
jgi:hypothetical protein